MTCDIRTAAQVLGIGRTTAFELLRAKKFPVRVLRMDRVRRIPVHELPLGHVTERDRQTVEH